MTLTVSILFFFLFSFCFFFFFFFSRPPLCLDPSFVNYFFFILLFIHSITYTIYLPIYRTNPLLYYSSTKQQTILLPHLIFSLFFPPPLPLLQPSSVSFPSVSPVPLLSTYLPTYLSTDRPTNPSPCEQATELCRELLLRYTLTSPGLPIKWASSIEQSLSIREEIQTTLVTSWPLRYSAIYTPLSALTLPLPSPIQQPKPRSPPPPLEAVVTAESEISSSPWLEYTDLRTTWSGDSYRKNRPLQLQLR